VERTAFVNVRPTLLAPVGTLLLAASVVGCGLLIERFETALPESVDDVLNVLPLPDDAPPPALSIERAIAIAEVQTGGRGQLHSVARRLLTLPERATVWIVVFEVDEVRACGPASAPPGQEPPQCIVFFVGAAIDDQTGEWLRGFETGDLR
jgi:hypothetical protein